ncbi:Actin-like ATPase domain-containing protein [Secundilactobacillus odoratitofui DSM 19909 = JCM 15043]|uniref:Actin-like ATPase domain-containing protein n=1 Tax=Secundilactobacillus odoratitofui DSM 19909 = JCM 15043 TaxID=1423776 RepID=A0A0R1LMN2_9LACO|nr:FGGY family carbohydrate kinase [Secundilactobacillus odoratitofui]KRK97164.1 Actin-like ATPase domain-containing protein [Secundilactobacillus odoratitofui DSM 19909 = JCM 15043]
MTNYLIGIDIGTSSTKAILMTTSGQIIEQVKSTYTIETPRAGWAQANANDWFNAVTDSLQRLAKVARNGDIIGVGIDGLYGGSGVPVDADGKVLGPTLIWMDRRATAETQRVHEHISNHDLVQLTGNVADPYFGFTKVMWLKAHEPQLYEATDQFLSPESYVIMRLTGAKSINYTAAGNFGGVFDLTQRMWSPSLAQLLGLDLTKLPQQFVTSTEPAGYLTADWAMKLGLPADLPIFNTGVDVGPATVGTGVLAPGQVTIALGTSMNAAVVTNQLLLNRQLIGWPYTYRPTENYYNFTGANTAGAIMTWFTENFAVELTDKDRLRSLDEQSADVPAGSHGLIVLPYFMGERSPLWDSDVRGTVLGLSLTTTRPELYQAFQEAIAYAVRQSLAQFGNQVGDSFTLVGGVSQSAKMVQLIADVTGKTVLTTRTGGEADLGSAMLAGIGVGALTAHAVSQWHKIDQRVEPRIDRHKIYNRYYDIYQLAYQQLKGLYQELAQISES